MFRNMFIDSMSVVNDLERLFPRSRWCFQNGGSHLQSANLGATRFTNHCANDKGKSQRSNLTFEFLFAHFAGKQLQFYFFVLLYGLQTALVNHLFIFSALSPVPSSSNPKSGNRTEILEQF